MFHGDDGPSHNKVSSVLLSWYASNKRVLPWRDPQGLPTDPYRVWISEIMLQQTTVPTVRGYFERFISRWPSVQDLAKASLDDVLHEWQGLGYYSRAKNLHKCAVMIVEAFDGTFPTAEKDLLSLPGVGPYTAAAIQSIAFNSPSTVVDGNVERVIARLFSLKTPLPQAKAEIHKLAGHIRSEEEPSNYAQALMDLGSSVCTPKAPKCVICPLEKFCSAKKHNPESFPIRQKKKEKPTRRGIFYFIQDDKGRVLLEKRPLSGGLFSGLMALPSEGWDTTDDDPVTRLKIKNIKPLPEKVRHVFTHFSLIAEVRYAESTIAEGVWVFPEALSNYALPTLMKKIFKLTLPETVE